MNLTPDQFAALVIDTIKRALDGPLVAARFEALEKRLAELDTKALKGGLPWARGTGYATNDVVQHDGSLWKCIDGHVSGATFSHEHFILQIKRGRDGKDAR
jgi:hypothetical protein